MPDLHDLIESSIEGDDISVRDLLVELQESDGDGMVYEAVDTNGDTFITIAVATDEKAEEYAERLQ